ncbi:hypothetical protein G6F56_001776 [Rhizopus delemar]|nr:hypothetical protein G6F56_001776 [Rhizopus delemar]
MMIHPLSPIPSSQSAICIQDNTTSDLTYTSRFLDNQPILPPRKVSDSALLKKPMIPPRTSSMPLNNRLQIKKSDENSWTTFLKLNKKSKNHPIKKIKSVGLKENVRVVENDQTILVLGWTEDRYQIIAGKREALFEKLMEEEENYVDVYLMNHTNFISSTKLLNQLIQVFYTQCALQTRILFIIHRWLLLYFYDFNDKLLLDQLNSFLSQEYIFNDQIYQMQSIIQQHRPCLYIQPKHIIPADRPIFSINSQDLAHYLSLVDHYLFDYISSNELIHYGDKDEHLGVDLMTQRFNKLNRWVINELVGIKSLKLKKVLITKFIEISKICFELNNFHSSMIITMGLSSTCTKLKQAWQSLSHRDTNTFRLLQKLLNVNANMRYYRHKLQSVQKLPCIPFLPVVLKDLVFLKENTSWLEPELINFAKYRSIQQSVTKHQKWTSKPFWFAQDLMSIPFFNKKRSEKTGALDPVGEWMEDRLNEIQ